MDDVFKHFVPDNSKKSTSGRALTIKYIKKSNGAERVFLAQSVNRMADGKIAFEAEGEILAEPGTVYVMNAEGKTVVKYEIK